MTKLNINDQFIHVLPYSEVCQHMKIAGKEMLCELIGTIDRPMVQIYKDDQPFSAPILTGEAGVYGNPARGYYLA